MTEIIVYASNFSASADTFEKPSIFLIAKFSSIGADPVLVRYSCDPSPYAQELWRDG